MRVSYQDLKAQFKRVLLSRNVREEIAEGRVCNRIC